MSRIGHSELKDILDYDPDTGEFTWRMKYARCIRVGKKAGARSGLYIRVNINGVPYSAHTLAWFYVHGEWAKVDHKNLDGYDNRIANLRRCTDSQNNANRRRPMNNSSGYKSVQLEGKKGFS